MFVGTVTCSFHFTSNKLNLHCRTLVIFSCETYRTALERLRSVAVRGTGATRGALLAHHPPCKLIRKNIEPLNTIRFELALPQFNYFVSRIYYCIYCIYCILYTVNCTMRHLNWTMLKFYEFVHACCSTVLLS